MPLHDDPSTIEIRFEWWTEDIHDVSRLSHEGDPAGWLTNERKDAEEDEFKIDDFSRRQPAVDHRSSSPTVDEIRVPGCPTGYNLDRAIIDESNTLLLRRDELVERNLVSLLKYLPQEP